MKIALTKQLTGRLISLTRRIHFGLSGVVPPHDVNNITRGGEEPENRFWGFWNAASCFVAGQSFILFSHATCSIQQVCNLKKSCK